MSCDWKLNLYNIYGGVVISVNQTSFLSLTTDEKDEHVIDIWCTSGLSDDFDKLGIDYMFKNYYKYPIVNGGIDEI